MWGGRIKGGGRQEDGMGKAEKVGRRRRWVENGGGENGKGAEGIGCRHCC